ncbi:MAG: glycosyltransferase family 2 protein [Hyphomicrobiales bacterium]
MIAASQTLYIASVCFTLLFASVICLRSVALLPIRSSTARAEPNLLQGKKLPVYTILVPLFHEANMIKNITDALMAIDYPQELLDIKLILEADDDATVTAAFSQELPDCFEIVLVPPHPLRTKPKALNFALPYARGEFVVIFDAEDRPDPQQLRKAIHEFGLGPPELVCLQASLAYYNTDENWLTRQFAIKYASLFDAFLPANVQLGLPVPLGGTSNHFKIEALCDAGCWDAYNVTEDADLGVRLARLGYQVGVLGSVTCEEAVPTLGAWIKQRSRWIKGWLQTWLVHTREPLNLLRELGIIKSLAVQIILFGIIVSAIGYPVFLGVALYKLSHGEFVSQSYGWMDRAIGPLQLWVLLFGFIVNMAMGWIAVRRRNLKQLNWQILFIPIYWMLISFASWYAVYQFIFKPFYWEKTNHGGSNHA